MSVDGDERIRGLGRWLLHRFAGWDSGHFVRIAEDGYFPPGRPCCDQAYFPGYPLSIRAVAPLLGRNLVLAGLAVSLLAGAAAAAFLWHLGTAVSSDPQVGRLAALYLALAPYGIFLSTVYSESLFLAFAVGAWWAGARRQWWLAGLLAGLGATVRISGVFLGAGLIVMYLMQAHADERRPAWDAVALLAPFAAVAGYFAFLHAKTGSWDAWRRAQALGWQRRSAWPWEGLQAGWRSIQSATTPDLVISRWAELLTAVAGVVLVAVLAALHRWPEMTYVGLSVGVLVCATPLYSVPRAALLWFPGYVLAAQLAARPRWRVVRGAVVSFCPPLLAALALSFSAHQWVS
jgi:hypothetical protein